MKFNHLNVPDQWQHYWTKYPEGYTILEALISWVTQVDAMVDHQNKLDGNVVQFRNELDDFISQFDENLQTTVSDTLRNWQDSGFLDVVISEALQWQLDTYRQELTQTNQELNNKVNIDGVEEIDYTNFNQRTIDYLTDGVLPTVEGESVNRRNIVRHAVDEIRTSFAIKESATHNKFDLTDAVDFKGISLDDGSLYDRPTGYVTHLISVNEGETWSFYYSNSPDLLTYRTLDLSFNAITYGTSTKVTVPSGGRYIQIGGNMGTKNNLVVMRGILGNVGYIQNTPKTKIKRLEVGEKNIEPKNTTFLTRKSTNLFDKSTVIHGYRINALGNTQVDANNTIAYQEANGGDVFTFSERGFVVQVDQNGEYITGTEGSQERTLTLLSNARGFYYTVRKVTLDTMMLVKGDTLPSSYEPYHRYSFSDDIVILTGEEEANANVRWLAVGDSITEGANEYPSRANDHLGFTLINDGYGGSTMAMRSGQNETFNPYSFVYKAKNSLEFTSHTLLTILYGTNDWSNSVPIGTIDSVDEYTYMGALNVGIAKALTDNPDLKIVLITPTFRRNAKTTENTIGLKLIDYVDALIEIGFKYNLHVIDLYHQSGFNDITIEHYTDDGLHPNEYGQPILGQITTSELMRYRY